MLQKVGNDGTGIYMVSFNSYYLQGVLSIKDFINNNTVIGYTSIKQNIPWIRGILNKHVSKYVSLQVFILIFDLLYWLGFLVTFKLRYILERIYKFTD